MHERKTAPTFLVYGAGGVFLVGLGWAWVVQPLSGFISEFLGVPTPVGIIAVTSCLATLGMQWLMISLWRYWTAPKAPSAERDPIQLPPDKRHRIQTGQGA